MFLRTASVLPEELHLRHKRFNETWTSLDETTAASLDVRVRAVGRNFIWLKHTSSGFAVAQTETEAIDKAISRALKAIKNGFNTAELNSMIVSKYPGFRVAKVSLHAHHIQCGAFLGLDDEMTIRHSAVR